MTYDVALCHPDEITKISSLSHPDDLAIPSISSGWLIVDALCHPDDLPGVGISSGWVTANSLCHPDEILFHFMSSGWLNWGWFLIRMSYGNVMMSTGWDTLPFLSHPDEIANFDFPHHAVAPQRLRRSVVFAVSNKSTCRTGRTGDCHNDRPHCSQRRHSPHLDDRRDPMHKISTTMLKFTYKLSSISLIDACMKPVHTPMYTHTNVASTHTYVHIDEYACCFQYY